MQFRVKLFLVVFCAQGIVLSGCTDRVPHGLGRQADSADLVVGPTVV